MKKGSDKYKESYLSNVSIVEGFVTLLLNSPIKNLMRVTKEIRLKMVSTPKRVVVLLKMRRMIQMMKPSLWPSMLITKSAMLKNLRIPTP